MNPPEFPQEFVDKHCRKVMEARDWRKEFKLPPDPEDDREHAECAFGSAGAGMMCENCKLHLTRPYIGHKMDEEFLPQIEKYYRDLAEWETENLKNQVEIGAYI